MLQTLVLRSNRWFPFCYANRWPYALALKVMVRLASANPGVRALYLRHGLTSGDWIPGLSDVDLSTIFEAGVRAEREFELVDSFRQGYYRLQKWFPMLGELEIIGEDDLRPWLRLTSEAPRPRAWTLLYGSPTYDAASDSSPAWRARALHFALWMYLEVLAPCLVEPASYLGSQKAWRRARKILKVLGPMVEEKREQPPRLETESGVALMVARAAKALEMAVDDCGAWRAAPATVRLGEQTILIVENGLTPEQIVERAAVNRAAGSALPMPAAVFAYLVRRHNPFAWASLASRGNALDGLPPPGRSEFASWWLAFLDNVLRFQRGPELFPITGRLDPEDLERELTRLMGIRLWVEQSWLASDRRETSAEWRRRFPECAEQVGGILRLCATNPRHGRREAFVLFRSLAAEVRDAAVAGGYL